MQRSYGNVMPLLGYSCGLETSLVPHQHSINIFLLWTFLFGHQEMELMSRPLTFGDQQLSRDEDRIPFPFPFFLFLVPRPLVGLEVFLG